MRKQGLSDKCIGVVYDAIVLNKMLHYLLSEVDNKLFACSKVESHCLHHMLPSRRACSQMALRPRGHYFDVP